MHRINRYWKEGRYIDLWSINHVLSGVVLGALAWSFGMSFGWSLLLALALFVGWELLEIAVGIKEHMPNMVMDVVCDLFGFLAAAYWFFILEKPFSPTATAAWILLFIALNIWGFVAYEERRIENKDASRSHNEKVLGIDS